MRTPADSRPWVRQAMPLARPKARSCTGQGRVLPGEVEAGQGPVGVLAAVLDQHPPEEGQLRCRGQGLDHAPGGLRRAGEDSMLTRRGQ